MQNVLQTYSTYNEKVGYCQSMNFVVGFMLLVNGGVEEESFWLFKNLLDKTPPSEGDHRFEGLARFYSEGFRLLT